MNKRKASDNTQTIDADIVNADVVNCVILNATSINLGLTSLSGYTLWSGVVKITTSSYTDFYTTTVTTPIKIVVIGDLITVTVKDFTGTNFVPGPIYLKASLADGIIPLAYRPTITSRFSSKSVWVDQNPTTRNTSILVDTTGNIILYSTIDSDFPAGTVTVYSFSISYVK